MSKFYLPQNTRNYFLQAYHETADEWIAKYDGFILDFCNRWNISVVGHEPCSRFGAILYAESLDKSKVVLKVIPSFFERLVNEINCYHELPYTSMCNMISCDLSIGAILLEYIPTAGKIPVKCYLDLLCRMYKERKKCCALDYPRQYYWRIWDSAIEIAVKNKEILPVFYQNKLKNSIDLGLKYRNEMEKYDLFYIHGDAHEHNILGDNNLKLIDPIGYVAPFEVEYARFLGTYYREHALSQEELENLVNMLEVDNYRNTWIILGMDVTLRMANTFFEGNTVPEIKSAIDWANDIWMCISKVIR